MSVPVGAYEILHGGDCPEELNLDALPLHVGCFIRGIKNNLSSKFYYGKSLFFGIHCWTRRHRVSYVIETMGTCALKERVVSICEICGDRKQKTVYDGSGVPF